MSALTCVTQVMSAGSSKAEDAPMIVGSTMPIRHGWVFTATGQADLTYTDNVYLTRFNRASDQIATPTATLTARETGPESAFDANATLAYDFYRQATSLNGPRFSALANGIIGTPVDGPSLRARVATDLEASSQLGAVPASARTIGGNQVQVLTYGVTPAYAKRLDGGITAKADYELSGTTFLRAPVGDVAVAASNALQHRLTASLSNDPRHARLSWGLTGSYQTETFATPTPTSRRATGEANSEYRISSHIGLLARGGYDWIDEPTLTASTTGPYALAGLRLNPSNRTTLTLEAGYRYGQPNFTADLAYRRSKRLTLVASFTQGVETSQSALSAGSQNIGRNAAGVLVDPFTGVAPVAATTPFDLTNQAFRYSRALFGLRGDLGRTFYDASGTYERRTANGRPGDSWSGQFTLGRHLSRVLTASLEGHYERTVNPALSIGAGGASETSSAAARLAYRMSESLSLSLRYQTLRRITDLVRYRENVAVFSLIKSF